MRWFEVGAVGLALLRYITGSAATSSDDKKSKSKPDPPCTFHSPHSGSFFDLNPIALAPVDPKKKHSKDQRAISWHAKGYDYPANFTLNVCAPVIEDLKHVEGVPEDRWKNVSAYYELHGKTYSIGQQSAEPVFRGRKMVLQYTDGSPCTGHSRRVARDELSARRSKGHDDEDDDDDEGHDRKSHKKTDTDRRKSTLISLLCERDALAPKATIAFVGASPDECAYFFELRSPHACGGISKEQQAVGPGGVFGVIALVAVLVYLLGGCVYQRTVMHARGWKQLPNYSLWAGIGGFFRDMFIILTSSCGRLIPRSRGYRSLSASNGSARGNGGRGNRNDDENRLIDQLDEEWDD